MSHLSALKQADTYVLYSSASFFSAYIGSYFGFYRGRFYEVLSFLGAGISASIITHAIELTRGNHEKYTKSVLVFQIAFHTFSTFSGVVFDQIDNFINLSWHEKNRLFTIKNTSTFYFFTYLTYLAFSIPNR
jgi:hypothetical protein